MRNEPDATLSERVQENAIEKLDRVIDWFSEFNSALVAFSSGVDSSVVAFAASKALGNAAVAATSVSQSLARAEIVEAKKIAREIGIRLILVKQDDLNDQGYISNQITRCYFCRNNLSRAILPMIKDNNIEVWVDGTQVDDLKSPRPGIKALREAGFRAPLVEIGLEKEDVRSIARAIKLSNADRPSESCLSSRIAYGQRIDPATLALVERSEEVVKELTGCKIVRVRTFGKKAVIELDQLSVQTGMVRFKEISQKLKSFGYDSAEIDPQGYTPGKMFALFVQDNAQQGSLVTPK